MRFHNTSAAPAGWTVGFDKDGRELLVVVVKATFTIPVAGDEPSVSAEQVPLTLADEFTGEPGLSAPLRETDFAHRKPFCDVVLNGSAYAPNGSTVTKTVVGLRVGAVVKSFEVIGDRVWQNGPLGVAPSTPNPFTVMPISYDNAYGGTVQSESEPGRAATFEANPVGRGLWTGKPSPVGVSLPNTQEIGNPVVDTGRVYSPLSFGGVGRHWWPRRRYAGTYDALWLDSVAPLWPADFDHRFFQCAPEDQQTNYLSGGEVVVLQNLTEDGLRTFSLPAVSMPVMFIPKQGSDHVVDAAIDTLLLEPDEGRFSITWRANYVLRRDFFEMRETIVGEMPPAWHRARRTAHKRHYAGLGELIAAKHNRN